MHNLSSLRHSELQRVVDFLLLHMQMGTREKMMAEMPVTYVRIYGRQTLPAVLAQVSRALEAEIGDE